MKPEKIARLLRLAQKMDVKVDVATPRRQRVGHVVHVDTDGDLTLEVNADLVWIPVYKIKRVNLVMEEA